MRARKHQGDAIGFCLRSLGAGHARCVVQMPTGSGKSFVIRRLAQEWIKQGGSAYVLCPTEEVIQQQRIDSLKEGMMPVIEKAELHASRHARYLIGSFSTMWRRYEKHRRDKTLVLIDECHHFNYDAPTNCKIAGIFERAITQRQRPIKPSRLRRMLLSEALKRDRSACRNGSPPRQCLAVLWPPSGLRPTRLLPRADRPP